MRRLLVLGSVLLACSAVPAQERDLTGTITGEGGSLIPIAIPDPASSPSIGGDAAELIEALRADLEFSGYFEIVDPSLYRLVPPSEGTNGQPRHEDWQSIGADALIQTRFSVDDGRIDLQAWLHDTKSRSVLFAQRYGGGTSLLRRVAHQLADDLVEHYTGRPGVARSRIAFVSRAGDDKEIYLMDYDGKRIRQLTRSGTINLAPKWSASGDELAFVSWRGKQPAVYAMDAEGNLVSLATLGGELSSAPDWSADGSQLVYSSNAHGNTEVYILDRAAGRNRRLTFNDAIDTSPAFSPNGREIAFTSDRNGTPQIYLMDAEGLNVRRVSWSGSYNESASWAPDKGSPRLAYASRIDGRFEIVVLDLITEREQRLTRGTGHNENPRWSADGRHLVFASNRDGAYQIYTMRRDGTHVRRLTRGPASYTPDWSR